MFFEKVIKDIILNYFMKIYFAASISGGRDNQEISKDLIDYLKKYGEVLTEHVGDVNLTLLGERGVSEEFIFTRDVNWIKEADVVVADVSTPSLGVGYEISLSERLGKDLICIYKNQEGKRLSAMIGGNKNVLLKKYNTVDEAKEIIDEFFEGL